MNCDTVQELMLDHMEGALNAGQSAEFDGHLSDCLKCRLALQQTRELLGAMNHIKEKEERASRASSLQRSHGIATELAGWDAGQKLGDFEILGEIGRGGMGIVYRARQVSLNRLVALKVLPGIFRQVPTAITRFRKEAQAAAKLHHTHIVPVYAQGEFEGHFFYAMELIDGESLDRILKKDPSRIIQSLCATSPPTGQEATTSYTALGRRSGYRYVARLIAGVAEGLDHAHKQGVIHRDIKPQNLLMAPDGQLHITDFGLARLLDEPSITVTGEMVGTPAYMSPEQVTGDRKAIDHRTDIFSLGVTFYEILTGTRPFEGATREQLVSRILTREPRPPRRINSQVPLDLETICLRAMEKAPGRRYPSAGEMATDLRRYSDDRPIFSRRASAIEKAVKWIRRHPAPTAICALSAVLVATAVAWRAQVARAQRAKANELVRQAFNLLAIDDYRDPQEARSLLATAEKMEPESVLFRKTRALAHILDDRAAAIADLTWVASQSPDDSEAMYLLAWVLRRDERKEESVSWRKRADALGGPTTAEAHFFRGQALRRTHPDEAEAEFRAATTQRKNYAQALIHLGGARNQRMYLYRKRDQFDEHVADLMSAAKLQPDKAYPRYLLSIAYRLSAEIHEAAGQPDRARSDYEQALAYALKAQQVEPHSPWGYACEADYWESRGDLKFALASYDRCESYCTSESEDALLILYQYRWRLRYWTKRFDLANQDLERLVGICPEKDPRRIWYAYFFPALIAAEKSNIGQAIKVARDMAQKSPGDFRAVTSAASLLRILGRSADAETMLAQHEKEIALDTDSAFPAEAPPDWTRTAYTFCRQLGSGVGLPSISRDRPDRQKLLGPYHFFEAATRIGIGDRAGAIRSLRECEGAFDNEQYCYIAAVIRNRMTSDPVWPPWIQTGVSEKHASEPRKRQ
jgi:serine/threonine protein kinase